MAALVALLVFAILSLAGGLAPIEFTEVAKAAGLRPEIRCVGTGERRIPEANGSSTAWS